MTKKIYNQPQTEIALFQTEALLQGFVMSPTGGGGGGGSTEAPRRRGDLIP